MFLPGVYEIFLERWDRYQTCFLISDTHFDDPDLEKAYPLRPKAEEFVKLINSKVGRKDIIICLGDCGNLEYWKKIRGYKILISGNHDSGIEKYKEVFNEVYQGPIILGEKLILSHEPIAGIDWALNFHGHTHDGPVRSDPYHLNINCDANKKYEPFNLNSILKHGPTAHIKSLHRDTIDKATTRKSKRGARK